mmetsp:Transcript_10910/g.23997  ORF Transcript_10910/g.23997 Transcript_10910/m.23997 type:complete len:224 (+) Transcript_10910:1136-1807(+)
MSRCLFSFRKPHRLRRRLAEPIFRLGRRSPLAESVRRGFRLQASPRRVLVPFGVGPERRRAGRCGKYSRRGRRPRDVPRRHLAAPGRRPRGPVLLQRGHAGEMARRSRERGRGHEGEVEVPRGEKDGRLGGVVAGFHGPPPARPEGAHGRASATDGGGGLPGRRTGQRGLLRQFPLCERKEQIGSEAGPDRLQQMARRGGPRVGNVHRAEERPGHRPRSRERF